MKLLSNEFDPVFYLEMNPDVLQGGFDPLDHYLRYGADELRDPSATFSTAQYIAQHRSAIPVGMHPFTHYVLHGKREGRDASPAARLATDAETIAPYFDSDFYLSQNPDVAESPFDPLEHYLSYGSREARDPSATFPSRWYRETYMAGEPATYEPLLHLIRRGSELVYPAPLDLPPATLEQISTGFDVGFYRRKYLSSNDHDKDPLQHYLALGWLLGFDPSPRFSTTFYMKAYRHRMPVGISPLAHFFLNGKREGFAGSHQLTSAEQEPDVVALFDRHFYLMAYPDVRAAALDPFEHYMLVGWKEGRDPNRSFSTVFYSRAYSDVAESGLQPLVHFAQQGKGRLTNSKRPYLDIAPDLGRYSEVEIFARCQDFMFPLSLEITKRLIVIIAPEHNEMSGGIYSMFSIAKSLRAMKNQHGSDVVMMTRPNPLKVTYVRQRNFRNQENVFRFEQILYCNEVEQLYLHIPEYAASSFLSSCNEALLRYMISRKKLYINILNQNIELMPEPGTFDELRRVSDTLTQSVAHHAYFNQEIADRYRLPTLLLPAYTDLREYSRSRASEKDDLVIYSLDESSYKSQCLDMIKAAFPRYQLIEIRGISFDQFMDLATRCRFAVSFGEGFDGYVAQPIYQGGIGMTVYREEFFPSRDFLKYPNFFENEDDLLKNIVQVMRDLAQDHEAYDRLNDELMADYDKLYTLEDYERRVLMLANRTSEIFPGKVA